MAVLKNTTVSDTGFLKFATGSGNQRQTTSQQGGMRFNTSRGELEVYNGNRWIQDSDQRQANIVTSGLINYYDPSIPQSYSGTGTTWFDLSGNNNNASLVNTSFVNESGGSLRFNGSTSYAITSNTVPSSGAHTVMVWARARVPLSYSESGGPRRTLFKTPGSAGWTPGLWMTGRIIRPHGRTNYRDLRINLMDTGWHLYGQVWDGTRVQVILDGMAVVPPHSNQTGNFYSTTDSVLVIGSETNGNSPFCWDGDIGAVMIYNRALTPEEIDQNYYENAKRYNVSTKGTRCDPAESAIDLRKHRPQVTNGFYYISQTGVESTRAYCVFTNTDGRTDITGGPWTVPFVNNAPPNIFSTNGPTAIKTFEERCREIGVRTPGRGLESRRGSLADGGWLATKRAIWEGYPNFVLGKGAASGGTIAMPLMNINGEGGASNHRLVYNTRETARLTPNQDADACNANQLICGWWGGTDFTSWATNNDGLPGPEDWGPGNASNSSFGGDGLTPQILSCVYR